ncbi:ABC transporter ATP-binding protein [Ectothiorhodospira lacustris]|uniref:ABC transporter ATP-binding protein n=1 Tax=Ectothiorhodospira lacustris TaxID=2899127 RepID=UPI001EE9322E|nr:dipeptide ABC transporter ATP-binding protein [Ectothiorhodospira lacustris]MCG5499595.1 dipeptide ABC transporter ATP-binding protein [Ectothiorhodospira lacustris]MCG5508711.1 dipeptide ABC transporter ATP-binding protein [Ectothiorhodospira lacustris]MCG5520502.1 dipeptide ABC transporter ATP-binding protein [Ectothiorhodospira lacustris]
MLLEVKNLQTHLQAGGRTVTAVDEISFGIERGETFCLVGESGSGKSVTALSVIQLLPRDISHHPGGQILFQERRADGSQRTVDMLRLPEAERRRIRGARMSMIFQEPMTSLNPVFTVGEQIMEVLRLHRSDLSEAETRERAIEALAQVQIPHPAERVDEFPHRLSGGQRQRVMIAMAMACEPDLLIADEPTTALDVTVQAEILRLMRELQDRNGMAMLFITHDFGVVARMGHRLGVMRLGRLVEEGTVQQVLHRPQHAYTRQLIDALPENLSRRRAAQGPARAAGKTPEAPLIRLQDLQIHFPVRKGLMRRVVDHVRAVDGVSLDIPKGQVLALVGESGCGKTTLGRAIIRLLEPTGGRILFAGEDITRLPASAMKPYRRRMQIIFQDPMSSLNPRLTVAATLTEPMAVHGIGKDREERLAMAAQVLEQVQLPVESLWRYPHEFSGGQRQRIGIARALVLEPSFIVCDEVTSALDVSVQAEVLQILSRLTRERGLTLLFITHNIGVVEYLADTMAVMYQGRVVEQGEARRICRQPEHEYTKKLLSAVPRVTLD